MRWTHASCPREDCGSSDAFSFKEGDAFGYCFSCGKSSPLTDDVVVSEKPKATNTSKMTLEDIQELDTRGFEERMIKKNVAAYFDVRVGYDDDGEINSHFYPYTRKGKVVAYKKRHMPKKFTIIGDFDQVDLFNQSKASGGDRLTITEGEIDAMSVAAAQYEKYGRFFPVVSLTSATGMGALLKNRDWVRSFKEVTLCLDQDEAGREATEKAAKIIGYDKVRICNLPEKDANEVLLKHGPAKLMGCLFDAKTYSPAGVVRGEAIWDKFTEIQDAVMIAYPPALAGLQELLRGIRQGDLDLFTSGTGAGKSTVIKEIVLHIHEKTEDMIGIISLEESVGDTAEKFVGMKIKKNLARLDKKLPEKELRKGFDEVFGDERIILLDHQGDVGDESLLDKIEHLALLGCKYIVLDHITIAVSEGAEGRTGNEAMDYVMKGLLKIVKKHNIWLGVISHLRKTDNKAKPFEEGYLPSLDDIKGSGSIKQIAFNVIAFARNMVHAEAKMRNLIRFRVLKARRAGDTGDAGAASYDPKTGRLAKADISDFEDEDEGQDGFGED
jgi:twinkle protein